MLKLLIAVDGSEPSRHAIDAAARLARQVPGVTAVLLNVCDGPSRLGGLSEIGPETHERSNHARQASLLKAALVQARAGGLSNVVTQTAEGFAEKEIARIALEQQVDQIVIGTRSTNAMGGALDSVAQRVVHLAGVPVLLVK